jgi:hypothetical protein
MERIGSVERKTRTRIFDEGNFRGYTDYMIESEPGSRPAPQAFLVHQQPGWVLPTHFHLEEQWQVVVGGGGTLATHVLAPLTLHYSTREAGYGPLTAGPTGLDYLTLRAVTDPGAWYLPESRERMRRGVRKRHVTVGPLPTRDAAALAGLARAEVQEVIAQDDEGLAAWLVRVPPGGQASAPPQQRSGGRYHVVVAGSLLAAGQELLPPACIWRGSDDAPLDLRALAGGAEVLVLQYPEAALAPEPPGRR